ncbi:MAG: HEAT repeat domain-containing protein [Planctomycetes bacterium]|nr:HEAT repeat domain-containing protein [Planctomycetota bacterium]
MSARCRRWLAAWVAWVAVVAGLVAAGAPWAMAQSEDAELQKTFAEGVRLYKEGNFKDAETAFNKVLAANPKDSVTAELREIAGMKTLMEMYMRGVEGGADDKIRAMARYLVSRYDGKGEMPTVPNDDDIRGLVERAVGTKGETFQERFQAKLDLGDKARDHAMPFLQPYLEGDGGNSEHAIDVCAYIGGDSIWPLCEMLKSDNEKLRRNVVIALGRIRDKRVVADLKYINEYDKDTVAKDLAKIALVQVTGDLSWNAKASAQLFFDRGRDQFLAHSALIPAPDRKWWVWRWDAANKKLKKRTVRWFQYNEYLAEESAYRATQADPNFSQGWELLTAVNLQMFMEYDTIKVATTDPEEKNALEKVQTEVHNKLVMGAPGGQLAAYGALEMALDSNKSEVALAACDLLGEIATENSVPQQDTLGKVTESILRALDYQDKRVRYAAARALCKITPNHGFARIDHTMNRLTEALGEYGSEAVLVIAENPDAVNTMLEGLSKRHFSVFWAAAAKEGLWRARGFPMEDVIICDYQALLKPVVSSEFGANRFTPRERVVAETLLQSLAADYRTRDVPILVICTEEEKPQAEANLKSNATRENGKANVKDFIVRGAGQFNFDEIDAKIKACLTERSPAGGLNRSVREAVMAAQALGALDPDATAFKVEDALKGLVANATQAAKPPGRNPDIVVASMQALGKLVRRVRDYTMIQANVMGGLRECLMHPEVATEDRVRGAVAYAVGEVFKAHGRVAWSKDLHTALLDNLKTMKDPAARLEVGRCLGKLDLTPQERAEIFQIGRDHGIATE